MEFKYYVYLIGGVLIVLMAIYTLLTYIFPSISLNKQVIDVEFSETLVIPEFAELGEFTYSNYDEKLLNEIVIPFWKDFKVDLDDEASEFELNFDSNDKKINDQQRAGYKSIVNYSGHDWQNILIEILVYYRELYSDY